MIASGDRVKYLGREYVVDKVRGGQYKTGAANGRKVEQGARYVNVRIRLGFALTWIRLDRCEVVNCQNKNA